MQTDKSPTPDRETFSYFTFQYLLDNPVEQEWIIEGMIMKGDPALIHAPGGVGKSMLGLYIALHLAAHGSMDPGTPLNVIFDRFPVKKQRTTLFIQAENSTAALQNRIKSMSEGNPALKTGISRVFVLCQHNDTTITGKHFTDGAFQEDLVKTIKVIEKEEKVKIDLIIIDPLISYLEGSENDSVETRATLDGISQVCSQAQCTAIVIHHANKSGEEYRGSTAINDWARNRISLKQEDGTKPVVGKDSRGKIEHGEKPVKLIRVTQEKCNNFELFDPFLLEMGSDLNFRLAEERLKPKEIKDCKNVVKVLEGMGGHAESQTAFAKAYKGSFKVAEKTAKRHIEIAEKHSYISKKTTIKDGKETYEYSLLEK